MVDTMNALGPDQAPKFDDSIDLFDLLTRFIVEWQKFLLAAAVTFLLGVPFIFSIKPQYESDATLLPQTKEDSSNLASLFTTRSPGDLFLGLLASRSVQDEVVDRAGLIAHYRVKDRAQARTILAGSSTFSIGRDTLVNIKVRDADAEGAQHIANAYLDGLEDQRQRMLQRESDSHNRFFQQQLSLEADALSAAEEQLRKTQETTGIVQLDAQTSAGINAIATVRSQVTGLRVQLASLLLGASEENPQVKALRAQIAQLESQEHALESASSSGTGAAAGARQMPSLNLDYARKLRELKYHEALFNSISTQYQTARLSEGNSGAPFVTIDRAIVPTQKAYPPHKLLLMVLAAASVFVAVIYIALLLVWRRLMNDPAQQPRLQTIRNSFPRSR